MAQYSDEDLLDNYDDSELDEAAPRPPSIVDSFYADPSSYAANKEPAFTPEEKAFVDYSANVTNDNHTQLFGNFEMPSVAMQSPHSSAAKGYASLLSKEAPLSVFITGSGDKACIRFSDRWFLTTSVLKIPHDALPEGMTEEHMEACLKPFVSRISRHAIESVEGVEKHVEHIFGKDVCGSSKDSCSWDACLYGRGDCAGVYKLKGVAANERDQYFLLVRSDAGPVGSALCAFACENPNMTLGAFASSPEMCRVREYSLRNNTRIMARLANALGLDRQKICIKEDHQAHCNVDADEAFPDRVGGFMAKTVSNYFFDTSISGSSLVYYNSTTRLGSSTHSHVAQMVGLKKGVMLYHVDRKRDYTVSKLMLGKEGGAPIETKHDNYFSAMPVGVGRVREPGNKAKLTRTDLAKLNRIYTWIDKDDAIAGDNYRLANYRVPDDEHLRSNKFILGRETLPSDMALAPVSVILPPARQPRAEADE